MVFLSLVSLSPILRTLTATTTSDSIWALAAILFFLNTLLGDYTATDIGSETQGRYDRLALYRCIWDSHSSQVDLDAFHECCDISFRCAGFSPGNRPRRVRSHPVRRSGLRPLPDHETSAPGGLRSCCHYHSIINLGFAEPFSGSMVYSNSAVVLSSRVAPCTTFLYCGSHLRCCGGIDYIRRANAAHLGATIQEVRAFGFQSA